MNLNIQDGSITVRAVQSQSERPETKGREQYERIRSKPAIGTVPDALKYTKDYSS